MSILIDKDLTMRHDRIMDNKSMHHYVPWKKIKQRLFQSNMCCNKNKRKKSVADVETC